MMKSLFLAPLFVFFLSTNAFANLIVNGSFEADPWAPYTLGLDGNDVTGWFIPNSDGIYPWGVHDGAFGASTPYGEQWLVLGLWSSGFEYTIQQTLNGLVVGDTYQVGFAIASEQGCCSQLEVSFLNGSATGPQVFTAPSSGSYWTAWGEFGMNFVASSSSVTIQFKNINPSINGYDLGLDNVSVIGQQAVPEPTTMSLFGLATAVVGVRRWRRRRVAPRSA